MSEYPKWMAKASASNTGKRMRAFSAEQEAALLAQGFRPLEPASPSAADLDAVEGEKAVAAATADLGEMTKVELLQYASDAGIAVNQYGTKKEILSAILAAKEPHAEAN